MVKEAIEMSSVVFNYESKIGMLKKTPINVMVIEIQKKVKGCD